MLDGLTNRLNATFKKLAGQGKLTENNIKDGIKQIRRALLEADVNYAVVKQLINQVQDRALGRKVITSVNPTQTFVKILYDELADILGREHVPLAEAKQKPTKILMVGLQGSGKTTTTAKLAHRIAKEGRALLVGADIYRPAAKEQLRILAEQASVDYFTIDGDVPADEIVEGGMKEGRKLDVSHIIFDTAGRLQIDDDMMAELERIKKMVEPTEILFVSDAMAGQSVVEVVKEFDRRLGITGVILTKMDSDTRGGAALSIRMVTGKPIKFVGVGEKMRDLDFFHPDRLAERIVGMGDMRTLVEKAQEVFDEKERVKLQKKMAHNAFTLDDMLNQVRKMKSMGSMESIMKMLPGAQQMPKEMFDEKTLRRQEAIILSMTPKERKNYNLLAGSRLRRIAKGSGTTSSEVNKLIKSFDQMRRMLVKAKKNPKQMGKLMQSMGMAPGG